MRICHLDIDKRIVQELEEEFGTIYNLLITPENFKLFRASWQWGDDFEKIKIPYERKINPDEPLFGFRFDDPLKKFIVINRDGSYHHFTRFVLEQCIKNNPAKKIAYLHIDAHKDLCDHATYPFGGFVTRIFSELNVLVYIAASALSREQRSHEKQSKLKSKFHLIKLSEDGKGFEVQDETKGRYVSGIDEDYVYVSTDLDVFSPKLFARKNWLADQNPDFTIEEYKGLFKKAIYGKKIIGIDFTGLKLHDNEEIKKDRKLLKINKDSISNLVNLIRFVDDPFHGDPRYIPF